MHGMITLILFTILIAWLIVDHIKAMKELTAIRDTHAQMIPPVAGESLL